MYEVFLLHGKSKNDSIIQKNVHDEGEKENEEISPGNV